jgi:hypothetical protein
MKHKEILIPMKYTGLVPCEIVGLGHFKKNETREIPERFAMELRHDRNWKRLGGPLDNKKEPAPDLKKKSSDKK